MNRRDTPVGVPLGERSVSYGSSSSAPASEPPASPAHDVPAVPSPARTRLVLVDLDSQDQPAEGMVLDWAQDDAGAWVAWTVWVQGPSGPVVQGWIPAHRLTPVRWR